MHSIVKRLNDVVGVKGSLVLTHDGIVIVAHLPRIAQEDLVAAVTANVIQHARRATAKLALSPFTRMTLVSTHGKMIFADAGQAYLVVVMDRNVALGPAGIEVDSAAMRIRSLGAIRA